LPPDRRRRGKSNLLRDAPATFLNAQYAGEKREEEEEGGGKEGT